MGAKVDLSGKQFDRLSVLSAAPNIGVRTQWLCRCTCGKELTVLTASLTTGNTRSCGCLQIEAVVEACTSHGLAGSPIYKIWNAMHQRCGNPNSLNFRLYGGRGIKVCRRWCSFEHFFADMGERPPGRSLERRNNSKGYSPTNCYWATPTQQARNKRTNHWIVYKGRRQILADWAKEFNMDASGLRKTILNSSARQVFDRLSKRSQ